MVDGSVKGLWSVIMGAFYFYIRWVGERVMSAHGVGQNIGIVVWESKYKKLEEKNKILRLRRKILVFSSIFVASKKIKKI